MERSLARLTRSYMIQAFSASPARFCTSYSMPRILIFFCFLHHALLLLPQGLPSCYFLCLECTFSLFGIVNLQDLAQSFLPQSSQSSYTTRPDSLVIGLWSPQNICLLILIIVLIYIYWDYFINVWLYRWIFSSARLRYVYFSHFFFSTSAQKYLLSELTMQSLF